MNKNSRGSGNPYLNAREEWLERYGSYISRAKQWRITALTSLIIVIFSFVAIIMLINQKKVVPYVVLMDDLGNAVPAGRIETLKEIPQKIIQSVIADVIENWRTVTVDTILQKKMIKNLTVHVIGTAKGMLQEWYQVNSPYEIAKSGRLVNVNVTGLPLPVSNNSYRVEWVEIVRSHKGKELDRKSFEAIVTVEKIPPISEEVILVNPAGIYITNISVTKKIM